MHRIHASMRKLSNLAKAAVTAPHYPQCPKCGHAPLPANQALPAACPACGLVLAKFGTALPPPGPDQTAARDWTSEDGESRWAQFKARLTYVPEQIDAGAWWARIALLAGFAIWGARLMWMDYRVGEMGSSFLHGPLLVFHEAGHVIFRLFGEFITIAGGTLGQLLMPAILAGALLIANRDPYGAAIGVWLFGVSLLDVAPYAFDALHPQLVLLGGAIGEEGGHDWIYLLNATGLLPRAQGIGWLIHKLGALTVLASIAWAAWILRKQHRLIVKQLDT